MTKIKLSVAPPKEKTANMAKIVPAALGSLGTSLGLDYISYDGDYSNISKGRIANAILNAIIGGVGGNLARTDLTKGIGTMITAPVKDLAIAGVPLIHDAKKYVGKLKKDTPIKDAIKNYIIPAAGLGILGGTAAAAIPAIHNINRAAERLGDGRAIRVSTSIRKRPNQTGDLKLIVMSPEQAQEIEEERQQQIAQQEEASPPPKKSILSKIFG
jgi:hypothetical protein